MLMAHIVSCSVPLFLNSSLPSWISRGVFLEVRKTLHALHVLQGRQTISHGSAVCKPW